MRNEEGQRYQLCLRCGVSRDKLSLNDFGGPLDQTVPSATIPGSLTSDTSWCRTSQNRRGGVRSGSSVSVSIIGCPRLCRLERSGAPGQVAGRCPDLPRSFGATRPAEQRRNVSPSPRVIRRATLRAQGMNEGRTVEGA